jgi:glycosyltransferase
MNTKRLRLSIVTPVFNGERFIRRTIESVLNQTHRDIEHIIVDGGSTDRTLAIIDEYRPHIKHVISERDKGMYDALNKGFALADGDIYCYLNADDYLLPDAVSRAMAVFENPHTRMCFGHCLYVDENERELFRYRGMNMPLWLIEALGRVPFAQQTAFWRQDLHHEIGGFDDRYRYVADTKFLLHCLRRSTGRRVLIDAYLAAFRQHGEGFSTKAREAMAAEHHAVLADLDIKPGSLYRLADAAMKFNNIRNFARKWLS